MIMPRYTYCVCVLMVPCVLAATSLPALPLTLSLLFYTPARLSSSLNRGHPLRPSQHACALAPLSMGNLSDKLPLQNQISPESFPLLDQSNPLGAQSIGSSLIHQLSPYQAWKWVLL